MGSLFLSTYVFLHTHNSYSVVVKFAGFVIVFTSTPKCNIPTHFWFMTGYKFDYVFDWTILKYQQSQKSRAQPHISVSIFVCVCV